MQQIIENLNSLKKRIEIACIKAQRKPEEIKLLLATKTVSAENIKIALKHGESYIGENKVQELKEKFEALKELQHHKHFIGHLQKNKIKDLLNCQVSCVQSIDNFELAKMLDEKLKARDKKLDIYIQVNTSFEKSKFGVQPDEALALIEQIAPLEQLQIKGLMTIGLLSTQSEKVRDCFKLLKNTQVRIIQAAIPNVLMEELSMGMSQDLEIAIEEGSTMIRVGTFIFGQRIYPDAYYWNENA